MASTNRTVARRHAQDDQLAAFRRLGYVTAYTRTESRVTVQPSGGTALSLTSRELDVFLSGLATGARGRMLA